MKITILSIVLMVFFCSTLQTCESHPDSKTGSQVYAMMVVLDTSASMAARGLEPSRLEFCKTLLAQLVKESPDYKFGLAVFAKDYSGKTSVSHKHDEFLSALHITRLASKDQDGTAIGISLAAAAYTLNRSGAGKKAILLLTDGTNNCGNMHPLDAAALNKYLGITIYCIGIGRQGKVPFPVKDALGNKTEVMIEVKIDEPMMKHIARGTGGLYFRAAENQTYPYILKKIKNHFQSPLLSSPSPTTHFPPLDKKGADFILARIYQYQEADAPVKAPAPLKKPGQKSHLMYSKPVIITDEITFKASVNKDKIDPGDELVLTLTIQGINNPKQPDLALRDFKIENTSRAVEIRSFKGKVSSNYSYYYYLSPLKTGLLRIPALSYTHNGKTLRTKALDIEVTTGKTAASDQKKKLPEIKLNAEVPKKKVRFGDPVNFTVRLYTTGLVQSVKLRSKPIIPGFWQEWDLPGTSIAAEKDTPQQDGYAVYQIRSARFYPLRRGEIKIPALEFELEVQPGSSKSKDIFDQFFPKNKPKIMMKRTREIKIKVK
jgi:hypothetical protein